MEQATIEFEEGESIRNPVFHWKRIIHIVITILLIIFLVWYYLPENSMMRNNDACSIYVHRTNQTCFCKNLIYYPNLSVGKIPLV